MTKAMSWGRDRMEAARADRLRRTDPIQLAAQRRQAALAERARVEQAQAVADQRFANKRRRLAVRSTTGNYVAAGALGLGTLDLATGIGQPMINGVMPGSPGFWLVTAAVSAVIGLRARLQLKNAEPPAPLQLPAIPPPVIPPGAVGAEEVADLYRAEGQLIAMIPAVDRLHPQAGLSLRDTLNSVQPTMHAVIERLDLVSNIDAMRAPQAAEAAETLRRRLAAGVASYDRLIAATATLLAAPDPAGAANDSLAIAAQDLEAYAAGLAVAADTFDGPSAV